MPKQVHIFILGVFFFVFFFSFSPTCRWREREQWQRLRACGRPWGVPGNRGSKGTPLVHLCLGSPRQGPVQGLQGLRGAGGGPFPTSPLSLGTVPLAVQLAVQLAAQLAATLQAQMWREQGKMQGGGQMRERGGGTGTEREMQRAMGKGRRGWAHCAASCGISVQRWR